MEKQPSAATTVLTVLTVAGLVLLAGCSGLTQTPFQPDHSRPVQEGSTSGEVAGIPDSHFKPISFRPSSSQGPAATKPAHTESNPRTVRELISAGQGGQLLLDWEIKDENGVTGSKVKAEVKVFPRALKENTWISIGLVDPAYAMVGVDLEFGTHGTRFRIPAEVKLDIEGLDLSGYTDPDAVDFYWHDQDTNTWVPVPYDFKEVELDQGKIQGIWYFEHFSLYSLGGDDNTADQMGQNIMVMW